MEEAEESKQSPIIKRIYISPAISPSPCLDFFKTRLVFHYYYYYELMPEKCI